MSNFSVDEVAGLVWFLPFQIQREGKISKFAITGRPRKIKSELPNERLLAVADIVYWCMRPPWEQECRKM